MNLASIETVQHLCKQYNLRPDRRSGQNFLICPEALDRMVRAAAIAPGDTVLEIGPGFGVLTVELASHARRVIAVEADRRFIPALRKLGAVHPNLQASQGDIFKAWPTIAKEMKDLRYRLVANLPYNITSLVLRNFLENRPRPSSLTVMVQKEVAERVVAKPGSFSLLALAVQLYGQPELVEKVDRKCFWPEPAVDSAILQVRNIGQDPHGYAAKLGPDGITLLFRIARICFSARRKQLHNNLAAGFYWNDEKSRDFLKNSGISPLSRAQELGVGDWVRLAENYSKSQSEL
ncbi:MAG: 16S rRNA (adenine(1518)-N(6)/adenine(1519)-N(6))-dimethyltransferase RsmA [Patescibacteria group bacterium]